MRKPVSLLLAATLALSACSSNSQNKMSTVEALGFGLGAIAGGYGASLIWGGGAAKALATTGGAVIGGFMGWYAANQLSKLDKRKADNTVLEGLVAAPDGQTGIWSNEESGHGGSFTPTRSYTAEDGRICRDFKASLKLRDSSEQEAYGTACRQEDGVWILTT
jgi:surface antigen